MTHETPAEVARREIAYRQGRPLKIVSTSAHLVDGRVEVVVEVLDRWHGGEAVVCHVCTDGREDGEETKTAAGGGYKQGKSGGSDG